MLDSLPWIVLTSKILGSSTNASASDVIIIDLDDTDEGRNWNLPRFKSSFDIEKKKPCLVSKHTN